SNEVQAVTVTGSGLSGTFQLTFAGQLTAVIDVLADTAATVQAKLEALPTIGAGNVLVSGSTRATGGTYFITFTGPLASTSVPQVGIVNDTITGTNPSAASTTIAQGVGNEVQFLTFGGVAIGGTFTLSLAGQPTAAQTYTTTTASTLQSALQGL